MSAFSFQTMKKHQLVRFGIVSLLAIGAVFYTSKSKFDISAGTAYNSSSVRCQVLPVFSEKAHVSPQLVSNKDWSEFIRFIESDTAFPREFTQSMLPDDWKSLYDDQPVSGVSWSQAQEFCKWRSVISTYHHSNSEKAAFSKMQESNRFSKERITCRLPTESELNELVNDKRVPGNTGMICVYTVKKVI